MLFARTLVPLGLLALLSVCPASKVAVPPVASGTQEGHFAVNASGAATYTMKIEVPPGTHGVQPALSVAYVSQSTDGLLGKGFALQGIASITRCQASIELDGFNGGVGFDGHDRFCLDGRRLVKVGGPAGGYGVARSVYHTAEETWTQVTAVGSCGSSPCSFTAQNKDGTTLLFGVDDSGVPLPNHPEIAAWQIKSHTDLNGNRVSVSYQLDPAGLQNLPVEIDYTANDAANLVATRKVTLEYERRAQQTPRASGGFLFLTSKRLAAIRTWLDGAQVLNYSFSYETGEGTRRDRLVEFQKCTPEPQCFPATKFSWHPEHNSIVSPNADPNGRLFAASWCAEATALIGWADFNGDGIADVHCDTPAGDHRVLLSTGAKLQTPNGDPMGLVKPGWCAGNGMKPSWIDFNGDSKVDVACDGDDGTHRVLVSDGALLTSPNSDPHGLIRSGWCTAPNAQVQWGNFDGDGRADLLCSSNSGLQQVLVSTGTGFRSPNLSDPNGEVAPNWCAAPNGPVLWADFNGDHMSDAHCAMTSGLQQVLLSNGTRLVSPNSDPTGTVFRQSWCLGADHHRGGADFNGDGLVDATCSSDDGGQWVLLSTGRQLVSPSSAASDGHLISSWCTGAGAAPAWADFNGDGFADLQCRDGNAQLMAMLSTGTALRSPNASPTGVLLPGPWCAQGTPTWIDFNADSMDDIACSTAGTQQALVHTAGAPDLVAGIADGVGKTIAITYAPLTDPTVYTPGQASSYPTIDVRPPMYVVSHYRTGDGRGNQYSLSYAYQGARTDVHAQRWLGFQQVTFTQDALARKTVTTYKQDYPIISFVTSIDVFDANGSQLTGATFTPMVRNRIPNVFLVLGASETSSTFTNGAADYVETTTYTYDDFGNATLIANASAPYFSVYHCRTYDNSTQPWRLGYALAEKTTRTNEACLAFLGGNTAWNPVTDLRYGSTTYDERMNAITATIWDDVNGAFRAVTRTFDVAGNVASVSDLAGNVTTKAYDATLTFPVSVVSPKLADGRQLTAQATFFRQFGVQATSTDANGNVHAQQIDGFGRVTQRLGPDPAASSSTAAVILSTFAYSSDVNGLYVERRDRQSWNDPNPANWFYERRYFDGMGRKFRTARRSARPGADVVTETQFDNVGRPSRQSMPHYAADAPVCTVTAYDALDRPVTVTQPDGTLTTMAYLKGRLQVRTTSASGTDLARTSIETNDPRSLNLSTVAPNGGVTTRTYDPVGQLLSKAHPTGRSTAITHDSTGLIVKSVDSNRGTTTWSYGTDGLLHSTTNGGGNTEQYQYDMLNRPTQRTLTQSSGPTETYTLTYDDPRLTNALGELTAVTGPAYAEEYAYSRESLVSTEQLTIDGHTFVDRVEYDPQGRPSLRTFPVGSQLQTTRFVDGTLNAQNLQARGAANFTNVATYKSYSALGQPQSLVYGNGLSMNATYYPIATGMARPFVTTVSDASSPLLSRTYTWNAVAEMTSMQSVRGTEAPQTESYSYDGMGWLTAASGPYGSLSYTYDLAGNITSKDGVDYNYLAKSDLLKDASNGAVFHFDGAGNMSGKQLASSAWTYQHDAAGRLAAVLVNGAGAATHDYDSQDQRIRRVDAAGVVSTYVAKDVDLVTDGNTILLTTYVGGVSGPLCAVTTQYTADSFAKALKKQQAELDPGRYSTKSPRGLALYAIAVVRRGFRHAASVAAIAALAIASLAAACMALLRTRRRPRFAWCVPLLIAGLLLVGVEDLRADLGAGDGYPIAGTLYFHGDQVESTILVSNPAGGETTRVAYAPFGTLDEPRSTGPNNFRPKFTTKERDPGAGLDYFGARFYDSEIGRFLEPDPAWQYSSDYVYGGNDPLATIDPDGRFSFFVNALIAVVVGATLGAFVGPAAVLGAYFGGQAMTHTYNPLQWDWSSGRTFAGVYAGAAIGTAGAAAGPELAIADVAAGIAGEIVIATGESAAFTALGGGSAKEIAESAGIGAGVAVLTAGAVEGLSAAFSRLANSGSRLAQRSEIEMTELGSGEEGGNSPCAQILGGEPVATEAGLQPMETLQPGDSVLGTEDGREVKPFPVVATFSGTATEIVKIAVDGTTVTTTPQQPFWVASKGWTHAAALKRGDELVTARGDRVAVDTVTAAPRRVALFNIEVGDAHTYFVSSLALLTHNPVGDCPRVTRGKRKAVMDADRGVDPDNIVEGKRLRLAPKRAGSDVKYDTTGAFPAVDFGGQAKYTVKITMTGKYADDFAAGNAKAGAGITEAWRKTNQLTWHHMWGYSVTSTGQWETYMQLVPTSLHQKYFHYGSSYQYRSVFGGY